MRPPTSASGSASRPSRRIGERAENVRLVKLEAGPAEMSSLDRRARRRLRRLGRRRRHVPARLRPRRRRRDHPGRRPRSTSSSRSTRRRRAASSALAEERSASILPMLVFEMQHSIDHYNACAKRVLVQRGVLEHDGLRAPAMALGDASRMLLERHLVRPRSSRRAASVSAERVLQDVGGPARAAAAEPAALDAPRRRDRLRPDRRRARRSRPRRRSSTGSASAGRSRARRCRRSRCSGW